MSSSTDPVHLDAAPSGLRLADQDPASALERLIAERLARAEVRAAGAATEQATQACVEPLDAVLGGLEAERERLSQELVQTAVSLGLAVARELTRAEIAADRHDIEALVRRCLAEANVGRQPVRVALHPDDAARLGDVRFSADVELSADASVRKGSAIVDSPLGSLAFEVDEALENVERALRADLRADGPAPTDAAVAGETPA